MRHSCSFGSLFLILMIDDHLFFALIEFVSLENCLPVPMLPYHRARRTFDINTLSKSRAGAHTYLNPPAS